MNDKPILFFDGVCGLCNWAVDFVMAQDSAQVFLFSPLQGETAQKLLPTALTQNLNSIVVFDQGQIFTHSDAVLKITEHLGGIFKIFVIFKAMPKPLRDGLYDFVARFRYKLFGKKESCRLPSPTERARFLP